MGSFTGELRHIFTADNGGEPMQSHERVELVAGLGIAGDRYAERRGHYSQIHHEDRQLTLIEMETLEALSRDADIDLAPEETRRNLVTYGVPLNHLVGRQFRIGTALLYGGRLNVPCKYLEILVGKPVFKPLINRSGLNCQIIESGFVAIGDGIRPV